MIKKLLIYDKKIKNYIEFNYECSKLEIRKEINKYSNSIAKNNNQIYYNNIKVTKNCKVIFECKTCGNNSESYFDIRGFLRHPHEFFCSKKCSAKNNDVIMKIENKRGYLNSYLKNIENKIIENNISEMKLEEIIQLIKNNKNFLYHEKVVSEIKKLFIDNNKTRKEISDFFQISINELDCILRANKIKKWKLKDSDFEKRRNRALKAWSNKENYKNWINKGGKSKWFSVIDKNGNTHKLQGTYELRLANVLKKTNLNWRSFHRNIILSDGSRYSPDFIIENRYIDTKSKYFYELNKDKLNKAINEINLIIIDDVLLNKIEQDSKKLMEIIYG